jgi:hypothetical protein
MSTGTTPSIKIPGTQFQRKPTVTLSPIVYLQEANTPIPNNTTLSEAMNKYQNQYSEFAFNKISPPLYGNNDSIARHTGLPANQPDFIADYHFIGLMRSIDDMLSPSYTGYIGGRINTPGGTS